MSYFRNSNSNFLILPGVTMKQKKKLSSKKQNKKKYNKSKSIDISQFKPFDLLPDKLLLLILKAYLSDLDFVSCGTCVKDQSLICNHYSAEEFQSLWLLRQVSKQFKSAVESISKEIILIGSFQGLEISDKNDDSCLNECMNTKHHNLEGRVFNHFLHSSKPDRIGPTAKMYVCPCLSNEWNHFLCDVAPKYEIPIIHNKRWERAEGKFDFSTLSSTIKSFTLALDKYYLHSKDILIIMKWTMYLYLTTADKIKKKDAINHIETFEVIRDILKSPCTLEEAEKVRLKQKLVNISKFNFELVLKELRVSEWGL